MLLTHLVVNKAKFIGLLFLSSFLVTGVQSYADEANRRYQLPKPASDGDFQQADEALVKLGRALFFDKELSGNRDIS